MSGSVDIAVVGGGFTGLMAAHHAALEGCSVVHITGSGVPGGLAANVGRLAGFPLAGEASALDLALRMSEANAALGIEVVPDDVTRLEIVGDGQRLHTASGAVEARAVIVATGARLAMLDVPGAGRLVGKGISQCAWCDGSLYGGKEVVVVGGGDSALQEALHLAELASQVTVVTRGPQLKARRSFVDRAASNERIAFRWETDVVDVLGGDGVEAIRLRNRASGAAEDLACAGVFVYVGLAPETGWLAGQLATDARGHIIADAANATSAARVFAAGAVRAGYLGRLTNAVGEAAAAALSAARSVAD